MSEQPSGSSPDDQSAASPGEEPTSPFARPPGYDPQAGIGPAPGPQEPRFAGAPHAASPPPSSYPPPAYPPPGYPPGAYPPVAYPPEAMAPTASMWPAGGDTGWRSPDAHYPPPGWGEPAFDPAPPPSRKPWILVTVLVLALVAGGTTIGLVSSGDGSGRQASPPFPQSSLTPGPAPSTDPAPGGSPSPGSGSGIPSPNSGNPLPNTGIDTPPGLLAIGYHAYSLRLRDPDELSLGPAEDVQFKKYGLSRIVGLRALTIGKPGVVSDDYDANISILRFKDAEGAKAELDFSNAENKKKGDAKTIAIPGYPDVTAFLNDDSAGLSIGAFTTVGRYQVVLLLGGLTPNEPTDSKALATEVARVLKALLPDAASIEPDESGGGGGAVPTLPTPTPSGVRA